MRHHAEHTGIFCKPGDAPQHHRTVLAPSPARCKVQPRPGAPAPDLCTLAGQKDATTARQRTPFRSVPAVCHQQIVILAHLLIDRRFGLIIQIVYR